MQLFYKLRVYLIVFVVTGAGINLAGAETLSQALDRHQQRLNSDSGIYQNLHTLSQPLAEKILKLDQMLEQNHRKEHATLQSIIGSNFCNFEYINHQGGLCVTRSFQVTKAIASMSHKNLERVQAVLARSSLYPNNNTSWASYKGYLITEDSVNSCQHYSIQATNSRRERVEKLLNGVDLTQGAEFWVAKQCLTSAFSNTARCTLNAEHIYPIYDGFLSVGELLDPEKYLSSCQEPENEYTENSSYTYVRQTEHALVINSSDAYCIYPERMSRPAYYREAIQDIHRFRSRIESLFCQDSDSKYKTLLEALQQTGSLL